MGPPGRTNRKKCREFGVSFYDSARTIDTYVRFDTGRNNSYFDMPPTVFDIAKQWNSRDDYISLYNARFSSIAEVLTQTRQTGIDQKSEIQTSAIVNSDILSSKMLGVPDHKFSNLKLPVILRFELKNASLSNTHGRKCVFLKMPTSGPGQQWSSEGCVYNKYSSNFTHISCLCSHLTNFAVLMDVFETSEEIDDINSAILTYITYIGGGLSILCCLVSIAVYEFFRLKSERIRIHEQLAATIIFVQVIFLAGIDRTENKTVCTAMAICLHYFVTAMFSWMLVEGVYLYVLLVKVFKMSTHLKKYLALGWGLPLIIVGISVGVFFDQYGSSSICWITRKVLLVIFVPTVGLVILINSVVLVMVLRIMMNSLAVSSKTDEEKLKVRSGLKAVAVLLPLLGLTWVFGFLSVNNKETLIFTYLFTFFNSFQGLMFFLFHCLLSVDVQKAFETRSARRSHLNITRSSLPSIRKKSTSLESRDSGVHSIKSSWQTIGDSLEKQRKSLTFKEDVDTIPIYSTYDKYGDLPIPVYQGLSSVSDSVFLPNSHVYPHKSSSDIGDPSRIYSDNEGVRRRSAGDNGIDEEDEYFTYAVPSRKRSECSDTQFYYGNGHYEPENSVLMREIQDALHRRSSRPSD
ncbi:hypothetical protein ScPMuIL_011281 [Solemya velum]